MDVDRLYEDFRNEIAPRIAEGFSLTKDYFEDVSGRLVTYLIVTDAISIVFWVVAACGALFGANVARKKAKAVLEKDKYDSDDVALITRGSACILVLFAFVSVLFAFQNIEALLSALVVPEIRVLRFIKGGMR